MTVLLTRISVEAKYQLLIKKLENAGIKNSNDPSAFM